MYKLKLNIQLFAATATITNARQSYSIDNNNEVQRITFTVKRTSGTTYWQDNKTLTFTLKYYNDSNVQQTLTQSVQFNFPSGSVGATKSAYVDFTVPHRTDGTQTIDYEASITTGTSAGTLNPEQIGVALETIPRASTITVNDANIGSSTNIVINKASSSFTTTLSYKASGQSSWTTIVNKTSNQVYGWTVPTSFYSLIPNQKTIQCQFQADTYSGNTLVGSKTTTATFTATGNPVINSCYLQTTDSTTINLVGDSRMIRYISTVQVTVSASGQNSASISSIVVNGVTATNGVATFPNANTYSYNVVVTDSRGYTTSNTYRITWTDYVPLTCNATIARNQPTDGIININLSGNYFNGSFRKWDDTYVANTLTVQYRYKVSGASSWTQDWTNSGITINKSGNTYAATAQLTGMTYTNTYQFEVRAGDQVDTRTVTGITVTKGQPIFNWKDSFFNVNGDLHITEGKTYYGYYGREDYALAGFTYDQYGNMTHKRNTSSDSFAINSNAGDRNVIIYPETGNTRINGIFEAKSYVAYYGRIASPNIDHQYPSEKISFRYDIVSSAMDSSGYKPPSDGFMTTYFWDNSGAYDSQLFLPNSSGSHLRFRVRNAGNWQNNWKAIAFTDDVPSVTTGTFTITKSSGNGNITGTPSYAKYGNIIQLFFQFDSSGGSTSAGSNVFVGSISGISLPQQAEVAGTGYYGSSGYVAIVKSNGDLTIRVISSSLATSNDPHGMSITYICS